jgi:hypothetical protein
MKDKDLLTSIDQVRAIHKRRFKKLTTSQQLSIIEGICLLFEDGSKDIINAKFFIDSIYKIAHLNSTCQNEHLDWHKDGFGWGKRLKDWGYLDFNKKREV